MTSPDTPGHNYATSAQSELHFTNNEIYWYGNDSKDSAIRRMSQNNDEASQEQPGED